MRMPSRLTIIRTTIFLSMPVIGFEHFGKSVRGYVNPNGRQVNWHVLPLNWKRVNFETWHVVGWWNTHPLGRAYTWNPISVGRKLFSSLPSWSGSKSQTCWSLLDWLLDVVTFRPSSPHLRQRVPLKWLSSEEDSSCLLPLERSLFGTKPGEKGLWTAKGVPAVLLRNPEWPVSPMAPI